MKKVISVKPQDGKVYIIYVYHDKNYAPDSSHEYYYIFYKVMKATKNGNPDYRHQVLECGTCREKMEAIFPELKELFSFHLRTKNGIPINEIENSAYYLVTKNVSEFAKQMWIEEDEADNVVNNYVVHNDEYKFKEAREFVRKFIEHHHLHKLWKKKQKRLSISII